jgi:uncharacterized protein YdeI (YjbR/CyaY-like superfamily)
MLLKPEEQTFYAKDRTAWRKWLAKNHDKKDFIWLIMYRKESDTPSVYYEEAVEEALCFGWIDSKANKRDDESRYQYFTTRKPKGRWSKINKDRVKALDKLGLIHESGRKVIDLAKKTGTWTALDDIEKLIMPADLEKYFQKNKAALKNFLAFPPSAKKAIYNWIIDAKQEETRKRRVEETVSKAAQNLRANQWVKK